GGRLAALAARQRLGDRPVYRPGTADPRVVRGDPGPRRPPVARPAPAAARLRVCPARPTLWPSALRGFDMIRKDILDLFRVPPGKRLRLQDRDTGWAQTREMKELGKEEIKERARAILDENLADLAEAQALLYADDRYSVLIVLQAMDAAGKDGTIKHVMSGVNPQGCQVHSFKKPSVEELDHNFLWRYMKALPERGRIGIFNRSYYEDVLVVKVHPELLDHA